MRRLAARAGVARLSQLGAQESDLEAVVEAASRCPELAATPGSPGPDDVRELLEAAL